MLTSAAVGLAVIVAAQTVAAVGFGTAWIMARRGLFDR